MVRCKFGCQSVKKFRHWNREEKRFLYEAEFAAVYGDSEENRKFFEATPAATLKLATYTEDLFEPGKRYYIDISAEEEKGQDPESGERENFWK